MNPVSGLNPDVVHVANCILVDPSTGGVAFVITGCMGCTEVE